MKRFLAALIFLFLASSAHAEIPTQYQPIVVLRALDKHTARVVEKELKVGETLRFGTLNITARTCRDTPPEDRPEAAAFLEIKDMSDTAPERPVFSGWMFASSPSLSAMEHPVYDIWVTGCKPNITK
jgi:hypothetical protein